MNKGLAYFRNVYEQVPDWVRIMNEYSPKMLDYYTDIRSEAFGDAYITAAEKDALIAAVNAGRFYDRSMVYHTQGSIKKGIEPIELVEYFLVTYLYKGVESALFSLKAIAYSLELKGKKVNYQINNLKKLSDLLVLLKSWFDDSQTGYLDDVLMVVNSQNKDKIKAKILDGGLVDFKQKYLTIIGCYITDLDGEGAREWIEEARSAGIHDSEMADLGYVCILTAGIPTWFELSDSLMSE